MTREKKASITLELMMIGLTYRLNGNEMLSENEAARTRNAIDALDVAISYLLAKDNNVPTKQPDPDTGLVPCGCGGAVAVDHWRQDSGKTTGEWNVICENCRLMFVDNFDTEKEAVDAWNTAMSGR